MTLLSNWMSRPCRSRVTRRRATLGSALLAGLALSAPAARAADPHPSGADAAFERGRKLMAQGHTAEACAAFAESNRIERATGSLLNLAACNEALGKTATAWAQFQAAEAAAQYDGRADRVEFARQHQAALKPRLGYLTLVVPVAGRPDGLHIELDQRPLREPEWNVGVPVDPGEHTVTAEAPGVARRSFPLSISSQPTTSTLIVDLGAAARGASRGASVDADSAGAPAQPYRTLAYVSGGVGAAALGAGVLFGARAFAEWDERNRRCPMDSCVTPAGKRAQRSAENAARNANIAVGVGLVALASGVGLYFLSSGAGAPDPSSTASPAVAAADSSRERNVTWAWSPSVDAQTFGLVAEGQW